MRILILGGAGMLGHRLWIELSREHEVWATIRSNRDDLPAIPGIDRSRLFDSVDVTSPDQLTRVIGDAHPELVINCVGLVKQRSAANDSLLAIEVNSMLPHRLANACLAAGSRLVHVSTDCVFSGRDGSYTEGSMPDAEDLYGRTKLLGEVAYPHTITLRTSIIGRELSTRQGLVEWFLAQKSRVRGYKRSRFSGVTTHEFARVVSEYVVPRADLAGLYHLSSSPITKFELLEELGGAYRRDIEIAPESETVCDRTLDSTRFRTATGFAPRTWPEMVKEMASDSFLYSGGGRD
ncbi:MAG: SDR family oxidoreductase [Chloroflexota bacterium]|nr:SDR family oxidoreductase [Chloroflexota bacterium]